jgi:hypothetical protein
MVSPVIGVSFDVTLAEAFKIDRLSVLLDQNDGAGNSAGCNFAVEKIIDG